jgi:hypothetical protein
MPYFIVRSKEQRDDSTGGHFVSANLQRAFSFALAIALASGKHMYVQIWKTNVRGTKRYFLKKSTN